jgi:hypothetical protein
MLPCWLYAQDITGLWKGTLYNDSTNTFYKYEIGISKEKEKLTGYSYTLFIVRDTQYYGVKKVKIKVADDGKIIVEDDGLISNNFPIAPGKNVKQLTILTLNAGDSIMTLNGPFSTNRTKEYAPVTGTVSLQRKNDFWQSALVSQLKEIGREKELSFVKDEEVRHRETGAANLAAKKQADDEALTVAKQKTAAMQAAEAEKKRLQKKQQAEQERLLAENTAKIKAELVKAEEEKKRVAKEQERLMAANAAKIKEEQQKAENERKLAAKEQEKLLAENAAKLKAEELKAANERKLAIKEQEKLLAEKSAKIKAETARAEMEKKQQEEKEKAARMAAFQAAENEKRIAEEKRKLIPAVDVKERKTVLQQTGTFKSDSLMLSLYDNGEVDGDTVSVLMNGELILAKQGLTTTAINKTIYIPAGIDKIELIMYAESLGSIPPNTGLLVIKDGKSIYEIRFSGDLQKNASIVFNRRKE